MENRVTRPAVFVGSSSEGLRVARAIQRNLDHFCEVELWTQGVFGLTRGNLESLVEAVARFDFAILVLTADDMSTSRGIEAPAARDNVLFELGLFVGALGRDRTFMVYDRSDPPTLPTDLAGVTGASYQPHNTRDGNLAAALGAACSDLQEAMEALGVRPRPPSTAVTRATSESYPVATGPRRPVPLAIAAGSYREGHQELFAAFDDGQIFNRWHWGDRWSPWHKFHSFPAPLRAMSCSTSKNDKFELFCVDNDGRLYHRWYTSGDSWSEFHEMPIPGPVVALAVGSFHKDQQELFVTLESGQLFHRRKGSDSRWSDWTWFHTPRPVRQVVSHSLEPGHFEIFTINDDHQLWHSWHSDEGDWSPWHRMEHPQPVVAVSASGHCHGQQEIFAVLGDDSTVHRWFVNSHWSSWARFYAMEKISALASANQKEYKLEVFAITSAGNLLHRWYRREADDWSSWHQMDLPQTS